MALSGCSFICQSPFSLHWRLELSTSSIPIFQMERLRHRAQPGCRRQVVGEAGLLMVWLLVAFKPVRKGTGGRRKIARCYVGKALSWMCVSPQLVLSLGHWKHWSGCHLALAGFIGSILSDCRAGLGLLVKHLLGRGCNHSARTLAIISAFGKLIFKSFFSLPNYVQSANQCSWDPLSFG